MTFGGGVGAATVMAIGLLSNLPATAQNPGGTGQTINGHVVCDQVAGSPRTTGARLMRYGRTAARRGRARIGIGLQKLLRSRRLLAPICTVSVGNGQPDHESASLNISF
jgi:hypothetical protein